jgi:hypothetical protein
MNLNWVLGLFLTLSISSQAWAQKPLRLSEGYRVIDPAKKTLKTISSEPGRVIDHVSSSGYEVYGPKGLGDELRQKQVLFVELEKPAKSFTADYPSSEQTIQKMKDLAKKFPALVTLTEIGKSKEGRPLVFARVTAPAGQGKPITARPEFKYIANMHGDEIVGRELMIRLIEDLASHYGTDSRITDILNSIQVYILPSMNPDGATHQVRYNADGVDLNRAFPDWTTSDNQNTVEGRAPELQAVMKFQAAHHFKLSANFHGGAQVVNYPWDAIPDPFPLDNFVKEISLDYSKRAPYIHNSTEFKEGITNGYAWYEVKGGMQDWSYHWYNDIQLTVELTNTKWPSYSSVDGTYRNNRDSMLSLIAHTLDVTN